MKKEIKIIVGCEAACSETMEIVRQDWGDETDYFIQFRVDSFYAGQSLWLIFKERLRLAWLAVRKGNYIHQEILTNEKNLLRLRDELIQMLSDGIVLEPVDLTFLAGFEGKWVLISEDKKSVVASANDVNELPAGYENKCTIMLVPTTEAQGE